jgi:hypothetical protein
MQIHNPAETLNLHMATGVTAILELHLVMGN